MTRADVLFWVAALILAFSIRVEFNIDYPRCSAWLTLKTWEPPVPATETMLVHEQAIEPTIYTPRNTKKEK